MQVYTKCADYATDACPCVLAEHGKCIICSMCRGEESCSCSDTVSFCIWQELLNRGGKGKTPRESMLCEVTYVKAYGENIRLVRLKVPSVNDFDKLGAYVFIRRQDNPFFDVPISVLYEDYEHDTICLIIQIVGIKTESFRSLKKGDTVYVRGSYYNGVQGAKAVAMLRNSRAAIICRGIGFIPSLKVIGTLRQNNNEVDVYIDEGHFDKHILSCYQKLQEIPAQTVQLCDSNGELTDTFVRIIAEAHNSGIELIHLGLSDHLLKKAIAIIEEINQPPRTAISFINNAHICCGEGICGACTGNVGEKRTVHLCKEQIYPNVYKQLL